MVPYCQNLPDTPCSTALTLDLTVHKLNKVSAKLVACLSDQVALWHLKFLFVCFWLASSNLKLLTDDNIGCKLHKMATAKGFGTVHKYMLTLHSAAASVK